MFEIILDVPLQGRESLAAMFFPSQLCDCCCWAISLLLMDHRILVPWDRGDLVCARRDLSASLCSGWDAMQADLCMFKSRVKKTYSSQWSMLIRLFFLPSQLIQKVLPSACFAFWVWVRVCQCALLKAQRRRANLSSACWLTLCCRPEMYSLCVMICAF